jgi:hypothetical protein
VWKQPSEHQLFSLFFRLANLQLRVYFPIALWILRPDPAAIMDTLLNQPVASASSDAKASPPRATTNNSNVTKRYGAFRSLSGADQKGFNPSSCR